MKKEESRCKVLKTNYKKYNKELEKSRITELWNDEKTLNEKYEIWESIILNAMQKFTTTIKQSKFKS